MAIEEEIKELAYTIWEKEGRPVGRELEHYLRAKQILEEQKAARVLELGASLPIFELAPPQPSTRESTDAYCVKCRTKRDIKNPQSIKMRNGRSAVKGYCPVCGTKMFRIYKA